MKGISIHLTDQCNQSCKFCVVNSYQERKESVNLKLIRAFLEENKDKGYECVNMHGGEPSLVPELIEILTYIRDLGYPCVSMQTNGHTLSDKNFAKQLVDLNVKLFVVSFHHIRKEEIADLANVDEKWLEEIIQGIKNVQALGAKVRTNTVLYKNNLAEFPEIIDYIAKNLGVKRINISAMHPTGRAYQNFEEVVPTYTEIASLAMQAVDKYDGKDQVKISLEGFPPCMIPGYEKNIVDWYDIDYKLLYHSFVLDSYAEFMSNSTKEKGEVCEHCKYKDDRLCGGIYKEYIEKYGWNEFTNPIQ